MGKTAKRAKITILVTEDEFRQIGSEIMGRSLESRSEAVFERRWMSFFGVDAVVCVDAWTRIGIDINNPQEPEDKSAEPAHFLWGLLFLKKYGSKEDLSVLAGAVNEKTFRKWSSIFVTKISKLMCEVVSFVVPCFL